jgi:DNA-binding IclR family transcriptional regulator
MPFDIVNVNSTMLKDRPARSNHIGSILVGFRIIECLESAGPLPLKEIALRTGMAPGHAHQYLASFAMLDLVGQDPDTDRYELGPYALTLGLAAFRRLDVLELAKVPMRRLERGTAQTVLLSVWANHGPTIIASLPGAEPLALRLMVGYVMSTQSTSGRIFLAHLPKWKTRPIVRNEKSEDTTLPKATEADLKKIVSNGLSEIRSGRTDGYASLAVPVRDHSGELCAALTLAGRHGYFEKKRLELSGALLTAGVALSARLGYRS